MDTQKVQTIIDGIAEKARLESRYNNKPTQKAMRKIEELGLAEFVNLRWNAAQINAIIDAAEDAGGTVHDYGRERNVYGDFDGGSYNEQASALYQALHEVEPEPEVDMQEIVSDMVNADDFTSEKIEYGNDVDGYAIDNTPVDLADANGRANARSQAREYAQSIRRGLNLRGTYYLKWEQSPLGYDVTKSAPVGALASITRPVGQTPRQRTYWLFRRS